jgi:hypothetical protein
MKVIAFSHLTIVIDSEGKRLPPEHLQTHKFLNVENAPEKISIMRGQSQLHDIYLVNQEIPIEFVRYNPGLKNLEFPTLESELAIVGSTIHSRSFDGSFFRELCELLNLKASSKPDSFTFRTLNLGRFVELRFSKHAPSFNLYIDEPGMSAFAVYVTRISDIPPNFKSLTPLELKLGHNRYKIIFVQCGKVWVELIERL